MKSVNDTNEMASSADSLQSSSQESYKPCFTPPCEVSTASSTQSSPRPQNTLIPTSNTKYKSRKNTGKWNKGAEL